ncbi:MAG: lactonase family protein [Adhaeribacter sp.]
MMDSEKQSRRRFLQVTGLGLAGLPFALAACRASASVAGEKPEQTYMMYVGTFAEAGAKGIYGLQLNPHTGALRQKLAMPGGANPSFLVLDAERRNLYAINAINNFEGAKMGAVSTFSVNQQNGDLTLVSQHGTMGANPCYVSIDQEKRFLYVANYGGGNVALFPIQTTGEVGPARDMAQHIGKGPHKNQDQARAHCILPDPAGKFVFAVDLGIDQVIGYTPNRATGQLGRGRRAFTPRAGAGPRILAFHPSGRFAYLICELNNTMYALDYDAYKGTFREKQVVTTLPPDFEGSSYCAHVAVSPDGRFLYGSNRGHNSLVVYAIHPDTGELALVEHVSVRGDWPRHFTIDPSGQLLLVANQKSNNIVVFRINRDTGKLSYTGHTVEVPAPVCLQVVPDFKG